MNRLAALILVAAVAATPAQLADVPQELRYHNWGEEGSCAHASVCSALQYHSQPELAEWWRSTYSEGDTIYGVREKLDAAEVPYAYTDTGDIEFLEWAVRNRMCVILFHVPNLHCVNLVDMDDRTVTLLDNNSEWVYLTVSREWFWNQWMFVGKRDEKSINSRGWAVVLMYNPMPPWPKVSN
jgi:hypothetical protein